MGKPKKRTTPRRTHSRRSHLLTKLAKVVNSLSPVQVIVSRKKRDKAVAKAAAKKATTVKK